MRKAASILVLLASLAASAFSQAEPTTAAYEKHAGELRTKLEGRGFTIVVQRPFIVIGDDSSETVNTWASEIIRGTVRRLKQQYFSKDPNKILDIWLFRDDASYRKHAKEFFGDEPDTPYGYYSPSQKALIMNISTGGGTLVHEIVHPFIEANFPDCPAWFNEGLGSLYEQSGTLDGRIYGYTNWRLPGLQKAVRQKGVPTFKAITAMSTGVFYRDDSGTNYAQARYLCYYLQERGLLTSFYKQFAAKVKNDPTGYETLKSVLGIRNMTAFQKRWERFVLDLSY